MRRSILLTTPLLAAVIAGCSSAGATPVSAKSSLTTTAAAPTPTSAEGAACAKIGSQPWKIDPADSGTTEDWLTATFNALPSRGRLTSDIVDADADLTVLDGEPGVSSPDAATATKFLALLEKDVQKVEADCKAAGVPITVKLSPPPAN